MFDIKDQKSIYDSLFKNNPSVMLIIDPVTGIIVDANKAACDYYQFSLGALQRMNISEINLLSEDEVKRELALATREERNHFRFKHKKADGDIRMVEVYSSPIQIEGAPFLYSIIQDITERRKNELEILELNQKLESLVSKRTRELESANRSLSESNESLNEMLLSERAAQKVLNSLYNELNDLYNNAPCGYHSLDENGLIIRINDEELKWLGYSREEVIGKLSIHKILTLKSQETFRLNYPTLLKNGFVNELELEFIRKDGRVFDVLVSGTAIYDESGRYIMSRSTIFDITRMKKAEDALKQLNVSLEETVRERTEHLESINVVLENEIIERTRIEHHLKHQNDLLDALINMINVGVVMVDLSSGAVRFANEPAHKILRLEIGLGEPGLTFEMVRDRIVDDEGYPHHAFDELIEHARNGATGHVDETRLKTITGPMPYMEIYASPIKGSDNKTVSILLSITDISERKQFEQYIQQLNEQLTQTNEMLEETNAMLEESNAELEEANAILESEIAEKNVVQEALILAKEEAENANAAKSNFLANMSHEIRTPMNGIIGMTELALMTNLDEEQKNFLIMVKKSANSLLRIINDVLDYTKIEVGKISIENSAFSFEEIVDETIALFSSNAKQKNIEIRAMISSEIPEHLYGDPLRIKQILGNLIGNAVKFTERGHIYVKLRVEERSSLFMKLKCIVEDTGIGIPLDKQSLLFERFSQVDSTYAKPFQGTGLGLAISKKLVELMGGDIWLQSSSELGSVFSFTMQLGLSQEQFSQMNVIKSVIDNLPSLEDKKIRVLVVEDDDISRQAIVTFLKKQNYDILIAENGIQAIEIAKSNYVDIILMDVQMPELDGFSATREIRSSLKLSSVPIIAMTAYALSGDREKCLNAGMNDYISKPINFDEIQKKIIQHVH